MSNKNYMNYSLNFPIYYKWYEKKFWKQLWIIATGGITREETFSLDSNIAYFILPRLKLFQEINNTASMGGYPNGLNMKRWNAILDKIILAFEIKIKDNSHCLTEKQSKQVDEGLALFAKWYSHLWW